MYLTQYEIKRKQKRDRIYSILASFLMLINVSLFIFEGNVYRGIFSLVLFLIVLYFNSIERIWAMFVIRIIVFIHLILLIVIIIVTLLDLVV